MNSKQFLISAGLATVLAAATPVYAGLGGGLGGNLGGSLSGMSGRGLSGNGSFSGMGQLDGLRAKNTVDNAKGATQNIKDKAGNTVDGAKSTTASAAGTAKADATSAEGAVKHDAQSTVGNSQGEAGTAVGSAQGEGNVATQVTQSKVDSTGSATTEVSKQAGDVKPKDTKPSAEPMRSTSLSGSNNRSTDVGKHSLATAGSYDAEHTKGSTTASGSGNGSFN